MKKHTTITNWVDETSEWLSPIAREQALSAEQYLVDALKEMKYLIDNTLDEYETGGRSAYASLFRLSSAFNRTDMVTPIAMRIGLAVAQLRTSAEMTVRKGQES